MGIETVEVWDFGDGKRKGETLGARENGRVGHWGIGTVGRFHIGE